MRDSRRRVFSREELLLLLNVNTWRPRVPRPDLIAYRYAAIVALVALCGVRVFELRRLTIGDWRRGGRDVLTIPAAPLRDGSENAREIPVLEAARIVVGRYIALHPSKDDPEAPLLINKHGRAIALKNLRLKARAVGQRLGFEVSLLTLLRSSFESWVRSADATDGSQEALLGHSLWRHVGDVAPPTEKRLRQVLESVHPMARSDRRIWWGPGAPPVAPKKVLPEQMIGLHDRLRELFATEPDLTPKALKERLRSEHGLVVHGRTIAGHLRFLGIGYAAVKNYDRRSRAKLASLGPYLSDLLEKESNRSIVKRLRREKGIVVDARSIWSYRSLYARRARQAGDDTA